MKRIAITLAALAISTGAYAIGGGPSSENYGSILMDKTPPVPNVTTGVPNYNTKYFLGGNDQSYGSVLADLDAPKHVNTRVNTNGLDNDISVGSAARGFFEYINSEDNF